VSELEKRCPDGRRFRKSHLCFEMNVTVATAAIHTDSLKQSSEFSFEAQTLFKNKLLFRIVIMNLLCTMNIC
jgi:hypothetical protein